MQEMFTLVLYKDSIELFHIESRLDLVADKAVAL
jgi:hypothetical protein